jgi:molybdopterin molybdotransferase
VSRLPTIDEALALVLARVQPLPSEQVAVPYAAGRCLAEDAAALVDLPPFDSSAMDGYAVRAEDTPGRLRVVGESAAGHPTETVLGAGEAIAVSTGAVVPAGADAVIPVEQTDGGRETAAVERVPPGANIRPRGGDVRAGQAVARKGQVLRPVHLGALASCGLTHVRCGRLPSAAVLATGTELRRPGEPLGPGQIYESNSTLLAAQLRLLGIEADVLEPARDDPEATREALERGLRADVLVTSGGVSVGEHDHVRSALAALGAEEVFWRVALRPGKPVAFAVRGSTLVFGLPGNPVSSLVGFELFVRPALRALQGAEDPEPELLPGILGATLRRNAQRDELVRARLEDGVLVPVSGQESHMIARAAAANALVLVRRGEGELAQGSQVSWLAL